ncbi:MAG: response regulator transcription factor [Clostridia bacterium]|nr:response regulator transcription factor [Clostridia bacterium]
MADRILIVDDDQSVRTTLCRVMKSNGLEYDDAASGEAALSILAQKTFDLILMDINLSGLDGFETVQKIRERGILTPIIIVSARTEDIDTLYGLNIGADDYITKPFNPITLGAKIKALIRRSKSTGSPDIIAAGPFKYNTSTLRVYKNDEELVLSSRENAMMKLFIDNVNHVFSKNMLYEMLWNDDAVDDNAIMVSISRLRGKIEDDPSAPQYLQTVRGLGYRFMV